MGEIFTILECDLEAFINHWSIYSVMEIKWKKVIIDTYVAMS